MDDPSRPPSGVEAVPNKTSRKDFPMAPRHAVALGLMLFLSSALMAREPETKADQAAPSIRLGIVRSLFRDIPEPLIKITMIPFQALMHEQTGMNCDLAAPMDAYELAKKLADRQVELA